MIDGAVDVKAGSFSQGARTESARFPSSGFAKCQTETKKVAANLLKCQSDKCIKLSGHRVRFREKLLLLSHIFLKLIFFVCLKLHQLQIEVMDLNSFADRLTNSFNLCFIRRKSKTKK